MESNMLRICSYCGKQIEGEPDDSGKVSHGMCVDCFEHFRRQEEGQTFSDYLDSFNQPIAVINSEGRVLYLNAALAQMLGKNREDYLGMRGGEVMECAYARMSQGCGKTEHCPACTIRMTIMDTIATGAPHRARNAILTQEGRKLDLKISTRKEGEVVYLQIDDMKILADAGLVDPV
jgi:PAS domain-containing protein